MSTRRTSPARSGQDGQPEPPLPQRFTERTAAAPDVRGWRAVAQRWVNVEFVGGPRDGEVHLYPYPPPRELCVPLQPLTGEPAPEPGWVPRADRSTVRTGRYRATGHRDGYEVIAVADNRGKLGSIMRGRRPMVYAWQGEV